MSCVSLPPSWIIPSRPPPILRVIAQFIIAVNINILFSQPIIIRKPDGKKYPDSRHTEISCSLGKGKFSILNQWIISLWKTIITVRIAGTVEDSFWRQPDGKGRVTEITSHSKLISSTSTETNGSNMKPLVKYSNTSTRGDISSQAEIKDKWSSCRERREENRELPPLFCKVGMRCLLLIISCLLFIGWHNKWSLWGLELIPCTDRQHTYLARGTARVRFWGVFTKTHCYPGRLLSLRSLYT